MKHWVATVVNIKRLSEDSPWNFDQVAFDSVWFTHPTDLLIHTVAKWFNFQKITFAALLTAVICWPLQQKLFKTLQNEAIVPQIKKKKLIYPSDIFNHSYCTLKNH